MSCEGRREITGKLSFWESTEWRKAKRDASDYMAHWSKPKPHRKNVSWRKKTSARTSTASHRHTVASPRVFLGPGRVPALPGLMLPLGQTILRQTEPALQMPSRPLRHQLSELILFSVWIAASRTRRSGSTRRASSRGIALSATLPRSDSPRAAFRRSLGLASCSPFMRSRRSNSFSANIWSASESLLDLIFINRDYRTILAPKSRLPNRIVFLDLENSFS